MALSWPDDGRKRQHSAIFLLSGRKIETLCWNQSPPDELEIPLDLCARSATFPTSPRQGPTALPTCPELGGRENRLSSESLNSIECKSAILVGTCIIGDEKATEDIYLRELVRLKATEDCAPTWM
jgi:hypothetical protein